jgi:hypothetical protein
MFDIEEVLLQQYYDISHFDGTVLDLMEPIVDKKISIDVLDPCVCEGNFGFKKEQLRRLFDVLQFPNEMKTANRTTFTGEQVFLAGLYRLTHWRQTNDWVTTFGWSQSRVAHASKLFLDFMMKNWVYLINDNVNYWVPHLPEFAEFIRQKVAEKGAHFEEGTFAVFGFIDNTHISTCRPGGGPMREGHGAPRWNKLIQQAFYNGWKKRHGLKVQTVELPNGMTWHCFGHIEFTRVTGNKSLLLTFHLRMFCDAIGSRIYDASTITMSEVRVLCPNFFFLEKNEDFLE